MDKLILKFIQKHKGSRIPKTILKKRTRWKKELTTPYFKTYYKAIQSGLWGTDVIRIDTWINGIELRVQNQTVTFMVNSFLTRMPR